MKVFWYIAVTCACLSMAWGGPLFGLITDAPPILKAGWRLFVTSFVMLPGLFFDLHKIKPEIYNRWRQNIPHLILNGINLAFHFAVCI